LQTDSETIRQENLCLAAACYRGGYRGWGGGQDTDSGSLTAGNAVRVTVGDESGLGEAAGEGSVCDRVHTQTGGSDGGWQLLQGWDGHLQSVATVELGPPQ
jgi:hypothetical protein